MPVGVIERDDSAVSPCPDLPVHLDVYILRHLPTKEQPAPHSALRERGAAGLTSGRGRTRPLPQIVGRHCHGNSSPNPARNPAPRTQNQLPPTQARVPAARWCGGAVARTRVSLQLQQGLSIGIGCCKPMAGRSPTAPGASPSESSPSRSAGGSWCSAAQGKGQCHEGSGKHKAKGTVLVTKAVV